jgi:glycosyltransferase involved in cell wall biosynthesis
VVNSICLHNELLRHGDYPSHIIRPGYDFDQLYPKSIRQFNPVPIIGGLYRAGIHGNRKRTEWLFQTVYALRSAGRDFKFWMMGSEKQPNNPMIDRYLRQPSMVEKNDFFNYVNIWLAPTMSEGLHLPPAEAGLTGCPSVTTTAPLSGTQDYIIHNRTGIVTSNNLESFIAGVDLMFRHPKKQKEYTNGILERLSEIGDRKKNMQKMVDLFERYITR